MHWAIQKYVSFATAMEDYTSAAASRKMVAKSCTTVFVIVAEWDPTGVKKLAENESFQ